ncbi:MAG: hypothetical protein HYT03_01685 [Candidatus Harrisonbacteria bacterium]|nr:hypothetical protein [Candidatus Harrisonbacteria bacterium]
MGKFEERELIRLWFKDLLIATDRGVVFRKGYYLEVNFRERYIVLPPDSHVNRVQSTIVVKFSDGSESFLSSYAVKKIDTVRKFVEIRPLRRTDLVLLNIRAPEEKAENLRHFLYESTRVLAIREKLTTQTAIRREGENEEGVAVEFEALAKTEDGDLLIKEIFEKKLVPSGRQWQILYPHPTWAEAEEFGIQGSV